ncbi:MULTISPECIES: hypothetical protein [unclassified Janthinobacterium]|jgi:hypothetical protein|uniref:hypothetical protein n=1 Tax=unclassified Janthinobacterium TaxID=2610881 RepID=UPI001E51133B|nr:MULTISPECIES: hypothetical protein [unclassified Janthinobacterium]MCC7642529.1 hypothetical protein [Janthinobacterium sp. EB271-G4-3-1]MCC7692556.1 hypothetical protein [Janthinobacterium sp. EB271-G4-3-2]
MSKSLRQNYPRHTIEASPLKMKTLTVSLSLIVLAAILGPPVAAQVILQPMGVAPIIAGQTLTCGGAVSYVAAIPDIAMARPGVLLFRPDFFYLPPFIQWYVYTHECAHQYVGSNERAADCWAIQLGRDQGFLPPQAIHQICAFTFPNPGDWTHLPGPIRCAEMQMCYARGQ